MIVAALADSNPAAWTLTFVFVVAMGVAWWMARGT
jgi:hypothetical protein